MSGLRRVSDPALEALADEVRRSCNCPQLCLAAFEGAASWQGEEDALTQLFATDANPDPSLAHDLRGAPYLQDVQGAEERSLLVSLSDEGEALAAAWARTQDSSRLMGLGVDLCAAERFAPRTGRRDRARLLLTERERALAPSLWTDDLSLAHATIFAAKEAAFKATAAPLRRWYEKHDTELRFGVRHFVMEDALLERGTGRDGAAQRALDAMGIERIEIHYTRLGGMALVIACALAR
jgi:phosphopantetheinyl transferase (holo-ACP synthase)